MTALDLSGRSIDSVSADRQPEAAFRGCPGLPHATWPHIFRRMETAAVLDLIVNGEARTVPPGRSVAWLLEHLGLDRRKVAVERNAEIVMRSTYESTALATGDRLEIVHFIGGG